MAAEAKVLIVIRTKNEEKWISHCFKMLNKQTRKDFAVVVVDNGSTDSTIEVVRSQITVSAFPILITTVAANQYRPGFALNEGVRYFIKQKAGASIEYFVFLSVHCIPQNTNWLEKLLEPFETDASVAGVYGRQLPFAFSEPSDKRDLLITFGLDRRVQIKDYFFHNANSAIRRKVWEEIPFDESATNIEDRIWAKAAVETRKYKLIYEPEASVYHHHGIHQNDNPARAQSVVSVMERFDKEAIGGLPESFRPENCNTAAILPVLGRPREVAGKNLLTRLVKELQSAKYVKNIYILAEDVEAKKIAEKLKIKFIQRPEELLSKEKTIEDVLKYALTWIESQPGSATTSPEIVLYANYQHPFRPSGLFDELIEDLQVKGLDTVFAGYTDYQNVWVRDSQGNYAQVGEGLKSREHKNPLYESLYGLGCASASHVIRAGRLVGDRVGILPLEDRLYTLRNTDKRSEDLIAAILEKYKEE